MYKTQLFRLTWVFSWGGTQELSVGLSKLSQTKGRIYEPASNQTDKRNKTAEEGEKIQRAFSVRFETTEQLNTKVRQTGPNQWLSRTIQLKGLAKDALDGSPAPTRPCDPFSTRLPTYAAQNTPTKAAMNCRDLLFIKAAKEHVLPTLQCYDQLVALFVVVLKYFLKKKKIF